MSSRSIRTTRFLNIKLIFDFRTCKTVFELAVELEQMSIYDTMYLAAAEQENCQLWTAIKGSPALLLKDILCAKPLNHLTRIKYD